MGKKKYIKPQATVIKIEPQKILVGSSATECLKTESLEIDDIEQNNLTAF